MSHWFVRPEIRPSAKTRVFCVPYAGVGASAFRGWADHFGPDVEVNYVQAPGKESRLREAPLLTVAAMAHALAAALEPLLDRPYVLFGHSLGAIVAFETVRQLRDTGAQEPRHLFVSACRPPHLSWPYAAIGQVEDVRLLREIDRRYGGTVPRQVIESAELREVFVPGLRGDCCALETYEYVARPAINCPISAFAGALDTMVPPSVVREWQRHTTGAFKVREIQGGHLFLQTAQVELTQAVAADLAIAPASRHGHPPAMPAGHRAVSAHER